MTSACFYYVRTVLTGSFFKKGLTKFAYRNSEMVEQMNEVLIFIW